MDDSGLGILLVFIAVCLGFFLQAGNIEELREDIELNKTYIMETFNNTQIKPCNPDIRKHDFKRFPTCFIEED